MAPRRHASSARHRGTRSSIRTVARPASTARSRQLLGRAAWDLIGFSTTGDDAPLRPGAGSSGPASSSRCRRSSPEEWKPPSTRSASSSSVRRSISSCSGKARSRCSRSPPPARRRKPRRNPRNGTAHAARAAWHVSPAGNDAPRSCFGRDPRNALRADALRAVLERLEQAYRVGGLPFKADREARLAEIRSVRLITLNYCPMGCSFCSSTNFLHEAQGSVARRRAAGCGRVPGDAQDASSRRTREVRTVYFPGRYFRRSRRIGASCRCARRSSRPSERGDLPRHLQFISTNRIDSMNPERLAAMRRAGFRVLGFGIENFSQSVLKEFNKGQIHRHIEPVLSRRCSSASLPSWTSSLLPRAAPCRISRKTCARPPLDRGGLRGGYLSLCHSVLRLRPRARSRASRLRRLRDADGSRHLARWRQATKILPADSRARDAILEIEERVELRK